MEGPGRFVGVGIDEYEGHQRLEHAVAEVRAVAEALGAEFVGEPLLDPDEASAREHLKSVASCLPDSGSLVLMWCGNQSGVPLTCGDLEPNASQGYPPRR